MKYRVYRRDFIGNDQWDYLIADFKEKSDAEFFLDYIVKRESWGISNGRISFILVDADEV